MQIGKKDILLVIFIGVGLWATAQQVLQGRIYNATNGKRITEAAVTWKDSFTTYSDGSGYFHFVTETSPSSDYHFHQNVLLWNEPRNLSIHITSLNGKGLHSDRVNQSVSYQLPHLPAGMHILTLQDGEGTAHFKLVSRENGQIVADHRAKYFANELPAEYASDTLLIEKEGFLSRKVSVAELYERSKLAMIPTTFGELDYLEEIPDPYLFEAFSTKPSRSNRGSVQEMKFVYEIKSGRIYYMNAQRWNLHLEFAINLLNYKSGPHTWNTTQYFNNRHRQYILGSISYYSGIDTYVTHYVAATELTCDQLTTVSDKIASSFIPNQTVRLFANQQAWSTCENIPTVSSEDIYEGQTYQGLTTGVTYGYLRKISTHQVAGGFFSRRDLILTDGIPNDLPVVAGIITSTPQTPLSHINVLSHSRNTPNMYLQGAFELDSISALENSLVYLEVNDHNFSIRSASIEEAEAHWRTTEPTQEVFLPVDSMTSDLLSIGEVDLYDLPAVGGKAANFGEIKKIQGTTIPTPEDAFVIPFYHYLQHIRRNKIDTLITSTLNDTVFKENIEYRRTQLEIIRQAIINAPIDDALVAEVKSRIGDFERFDAYRFRSSTNAEDLELFTGAGLYNSYSVKKEHSTKTVENAIRKVWASLWNWRAFEERAYFKINHLSCAMGILVHRSFPDEDANGVLITRNLYNENPGFIINVQHGEESIVFPREGIIHDQIILFTWSVRPGERYMIEYITYSNLENKSMATALTDDEIIALGDYATAIKRHYYYNTPHSCDCVYDDFGVDIEFKIDSEVTNRKIYIKQARLYQ